ncbi:MAG TPA: YihY/virulence factor BrkB family protein [Tepidisphaeraceae bacterium]|jgi:membrane protein
MDAKPENQPGVVAALKETYNEFSKDDVMTQAAAVAYYTGLSIAPVLTVAVWIARFFFRDKSSDEVWKVLKSAIGEQAAAPLLTMLDPASKQLSGGMTLAGIGSLVIVFISASGVFGQLQAALNAIWGVKQDANAGIMGLITKRLLSFGMLLSIIFLLLISVIIGSAIQGIVSRGGTDEATGVMAVIVNNAVSFGVYTVLFAAMFRFLPDTRIDWKHVWFGAVVTAVMFLVGKFGLSLYLGRGSYESQYTDAIGGFVALLVWIYYSAVILLVGAEITQVYARRHGHKIEPDEHAVRVIKRTETVAT